VGRFRGNQGASSLVLARGDRDGRAGFKRERGPRWNVKTSVCPQKDSNLRTWLREHSSALLQGTVRSAPEAGCVAVAMDVGNGR
jgi:hypothetical protein